MNRLVLQRLDELFALLLPGDERSLKVKNFVGNYVCKELFEISRSHLGKNREAREAILELAENFKLLNFDIVKYSIKTNDIKNLPVLVLETLKELVSEGFWEWFINEPKIFWSSDFKKIDFIKKDIKSGLFAAYKPKMPGNYFSIGRLTDGIKGYEPYKPLTEEEQAAFISAFTELIKSHSEEFIELMDKNM